MPFGPKQDLQGKAFTARTNINIYILHSNQIKPKIIVSASAEDSTLKNEGLKLINNSEIIHSSFNQGTTRVTGHEYQPPTVPKGPTRRKNPRLN